MRRIGIIALISALLPAAFAFGSPAGPPATAAALFFEDCNADVLQADDGVFSLDYEPALFDVRTRSEDGIWRLQAKPRAGASPSWEDRVRVHVPAGGGLASVSVRAVRSGVDVGRLACDLSFRGERGAASFGLPEGRGRSLAFELVDCSAALALDGAAEDFGLDLVHDGSAVDLPFPDYDHLKRSYRRAAADPGAPRVKAVLRGSCAFAVEIGPGTVSFVSMP